jgi:hypothetical protein
MSKSIGIASLVAALALASVSLAQAPASAPAGSTGLCKDGSYYSGASKKGACAGHQGVKEWYGTAPAASATGSATPAAAAKAAPAAAATAAPAAAAGVAPAAAKPAKTAAAPATVAAPGGGPGMVWVNKSTKAYHCSTDKWYGKTRNGEYLSEANAKAQGFHAAHGKGCQ